MKWSAISVVFVALQLGCSADKDAATRRLDELQAEIGRLRASQIALQDRLEAVETRAAAPPPVTEALVDDDRPELAVVKVTPEPPEEPEEVAPSDTEERPSIVGDRHRVEVERSP